MVSVATVSPSIVWHRLSDQLEPRQVQPIGWFMMTLLVYFHEAVCKTGVLPLQALAYAKQKTREETVYQHCMDIIGGFCLHTKERWTFPATFKLVN